MSVSVEQQNKTRGLELLVGVGAIAACATHSLTDVSEWIHQGFTVYHLWANYAAFVALPFVSVGLYAVQRPRIGTLGLVGSLLYGVAFVYFAHTSLYALVEEVPNYEALLARLGTTYTVHGAIMVLGGCAFGVATYRARVFPRWTAGLFLSGIALNLTLSVAAAPDLLQTLGSALRNAALIAMGVVLVGSGVGATQTASDSIA